MKNLKILVSLVWVFVVFSLSNVSATGNNVDDFFNGYYYGNYDYDDYDKYKDYEDYEFKIYEFEKMYKAIKQNKKFNEEFFLEVDVVAKGIWNPDLPGLKVVKKTYNEMGQLVPIYPSTKLTETYTLEFSTSQIIGKVYRKTFIERTIKNYFSFKQPERFEEKFADKVGNLDYYEIPNLIFKKDGVANVNINLKKDYIQNVIKELAKLFNDYNQYRFKIKGSEVICLSEHEEGRDLEELINYCIRVLKFGEFITENPGIIDEWYEYRNLHFLDFKV